MIKFKESNFTEAFGIVEVTEIISSRTIEKSGNTISRAKTEMGNVVIISPEPIKKGEITVSWLNPDSGLLWSDQRKGD